MNEYKTGQEPRIDDVIDAKFQNGKIDGAVVEKIEQGWLLLCRAPNGAPFWAASDQCLLVSRVPSPDDDLQMAREILARSAELATGPTWFVQHAIAKLAVAVQRLHARLDTCQS